MTEDAANTLPPEAARDLKQLLLRRIANIEAAMTNLKAIIQRNQQPNAPSDTDES